MRKMCGGGKWKTSFSRFICHMQSSHCMAIVKKKKFNSLLARQNLANCRNHKCNSMHSLCVMVKNLLVLLVSMYKYQTIKIPY